MLVDCQRRILGFLLILSFCMILLGLKLFKIQILQGAALSQQAVRQRALGLVILDGRGDIQDRYGRSLLDSRHEVGLVAFPAQYRGREDEILQSLNYIQGIEKIAAPPYGVLPFWVSTALSEGFTPALENLPGLVPAPKPRRYGPGMLATLLIGYMDGEGRGVSGIERAFDDELSRGQKTVLAALVDRRNRLIPGLGYRIRKDDTYSRNVVLSLDGRLQREVEQIMDRYIRQGAVVIMDPWNGDILAMASRPNYDPNVLSQPPLGGARVTDEQLHNRVVSRPMEPGSSFKILTLAAAIDYGVIDEITGLYCAGRTTVGGRELGCWGKYRYQGHGAQTPAQVLANSCNLCAAQIATRLGRERFYEFLRRCGIGELPRAGFPGEKGGRLPRPEEMGVRDLANIGFGQGVSVTDLQLAAAISAIMNGGVYYQPHIAREYVNPVTGEHYEARPRQVRRVCSERTSEIMRRMTRQVVDSGTGRAVAIEGQAVGGKTATAQIPDPVHGGYLSGEYLMAFVVIAPVDRHPDFVILVSVERPETGEHGSDVAGPMARQIAQYLLQQPRLFPSADAPADVSRTSGAAELG